MKHRKEKTKKSFISGNIRSFYSLVSAALVLTIASPALAVPKTLLISLDGATPSFIEQYLNLHVYSNNKLAVVIICTAH